MDQPFVRTSGYIMSMYYWLSSQSNILGCHGRVSVGIWPVAYSKNSSLLDVSITHFMVPISDHFFDPFYKLAMHCMKGS